MSDPAKESEGGFKSLVRRTEGLQPWRRVFHALCGLAIVAVVEYGGFGRTTDLLLLGTGIAACLALDWIRLSVPDANLAFFRCFAAIASPREARRIASSTWYLCGALLALLIAPPHLFAPSVLVLALADPAASVVGRLWGRRPLGKGSWEGTTAFLLVAFVVTLPFVGLPGALAAACVAAAFEVLPTGIDDNLTVPVASALALRLVESAGLALAAW